MDKIERIKQLVKICTYHSKKYYTEDRPEISDKQYDVLYSELLELEKETGFILSNSPTQTVQGEVLPFLKKVTHSEPMLSADKSKDINDVIKFMGNKPCVLSWKLDGLTLVLKYDKGIFQQAITRGRHGIEGEDVTHTVRHFTNIPLSIDYKGYLELRGEGLISYYDFDRINNVLISKGEEIYASPRNLASGSVRQLDANITKERNLFFIAFGIVKCNKKFRHKIFQFQFLHELGFEVVHHVLINKDMLENNIQEFENNLSNLPYLTDGLIIEYDNIEYGKSLGSTGHHSRALYALKWNDDSNETTFRGVELNTTRTGITSITGLFDEVEIDGVKVSRASLHNYDIFKELELGIGDKITVYRANSVIPQLEDNLTRSGTYKIEMKCPSCESELVIKRPKEARFLYCPNDNCPSKMLSKFTHFVSKDGMDIVGLSEAQLEKFINKGFINTFADIYHISQYKNSIVNMDGFGSKSYEKLIKSIENSRKVKLSNLLYALGINNVGVNSSKIIAKYFNNDWNKFIKACAEGFNFSQLEDFGEITNKAIHNWFNNPEEKILWLVLIDELEIIKEEKKELTRKSLKGFTFVVTGSVNHFANRKELQNKIEELQGKVAGSVSSKTNYLINNDINSTSGKNKIAKELGVKVISEEMFLDMIK